MKRIRSAVVFLASLLLVIGCSSKNVAPLGQHAPTTIYKSFELYYPGKSAGHYSEWKCTAEISGSQFKKEFEPTSQVGIESDGIRVEFAMALPIYQDTEYTFTTTYRVDGELRTRVEKSVLSRTNK